jgi:hypothetical protein
LNRTNIKNSFEFGFVPMLPFRALPESAANSARDRFYYQFPARMSTRPGDGWGPTLQPDQPSVEILTSGNNRYNGRRADENIQDSGI